MYPLRISANSLHRIILVILCVFLFAFSVLGQSQKSRQQLEKERQEHKKNIEQTNKILEQTRQKKKANLGQLSALEQQINHRQDYVNNLLAELDALEHDIMETRKVLQALERDVARLKEEYARLIYGSYKTNNFVFRLIFIFSAQSLTDFMLRVKYLEQYVSARKTQTEAIDKVGAQLKLKNDELTQRYTEKQSIARTQQIETHNLAALKDEKVKLVDDLEKQEGHLRKELEAKKKALQGLDKMIENMLKQEQQKQKKNKVVATPEVKQLSSNFAENKGKLTWPVQNGFISGKFGRYIHPVLKVEVDNLGVDIQTNAGEQVRSVFEGTVVAVLEVPGMNYMVMVQHGDYYTVYANVVSVLVKNGDKVNAKTPLATVYTNDDGISELQFQIWNNQDKMNPQQWLYKK